MKSAAIGALLLSAITSTVTFAATPIDGWYGSVFGGYTYMPNNVSAVQNGYFFNENAYNPGYNAGGRFGYKSTPLRYEAEVTYLRATEDHFNVNFVRQTGTDGYGQALMAMANVYYDFPDVIPAIEPFLGAGLGYTWASVELTSTGPLPITYARFKGSNSLFTYQVTPGFHYNFSEFYAISAAYRYVCTERSGQFNSNFQAHLATLGAVFRFDQANYK